jgi:hypothetical protein
MCGDDQWLERYLAVRDSKGLAAKRGDSVTCAVTRYGIGDGACARATGVHRASRGPAPGHLAIEACRADPRSEGVRLRLRVSGKAERRIGFLDKLAVPDRVVKLTLYDILLVLRKCESTNEKVSPDRVCVWKLRESSSNTLLR